MHRFYAYWWLAIPASEVLEVAVRKALAAHALAIDFEELVFCTRELELVKQRRLLLSDTIDFDAHAAEYGWIACSYHIGTPLTAADFRTLRNEMDIERIERELAAEAERKQRLLDPKHVLRTMEQEELRKQKLLGLLEEKLEPHEFLLVRAMHEIIFYRNYQKETVNECQGASESYLRRIATDMGLGWQQFLAHSPYEIMEEQIDPLHKQKRSAFAIVLEKGACQVYDDPAPWMLPEQRAEQGNIHELRGAIACRGKATGRVRIISEKKDLALFQKGEVLVTSMTSIDYVHAMRHAAAIVTNEGGITCHAAIFSRELGIPCIIGTRHATQVFQTGDVVEVDALQGIVKIEK